MARDQECVVCGKARFLVEKEWCFSPFICSKECGEEMPLSWFSDVLSEREATRSANTFEICDGIYVLWVRGG